MQGSSSLHLKVFIQLFHSELCIVNSELCIVNYELFIIKMQGSSSLHLFLYSVFTDKEFLVLLLSKNKTKSILKSQFLIYNS